MLLSHLTLSFNVLCFCTSIRPHEMCLFSSFSADSRSKVLLKAVSAVMLIVIYLIITSCREIAAIPDRAFQLM